MNVFFKYVIIFSGDIMDEKAYILKEKSIRCILSYIAVVLVIVPILYMTITKMNENINTLLLQIIVNLISYTSLTIIFIIILRRYLFDDLKDFKKNILICLLIILVSWFLIKGSELLCDLFYKAINQEMSGDNQNSVVDCIKENAFLMSISTCFLAPFVEEIVFRKNIFSFFKNDWIGLLVSTLCFGLIHVLSTMDFIHILPYLFGGALFSLFYVLSKRNIWVTIIAHSLVNIISYILILTAL